MPLRGATKDENVAGRRGGRRKSGAASPFLRMARGCCEAPRTVAGSGASRPSTRRRLVTRRQPGVAPESCGARWAMEVVLERCAGLDVHKKSVVACVLVASATREAPPPEIRTFGTMTADLERLAAW